MPNRVLKESITTSETIDHLDDASEVLFYRLITKCDDFGRFDARMPILLAQVYPLRVGMISAEEMERRLQNLASAGLITLYTVDGKRYLQMVTWRKHQSVRASKSKYPDPAESETSGEQPGEPIPNCEQSQAIESNCMQLKANVPARVPVPAPVPDYVPVPENARDAVADPTRSGMLSSDLSATRYPLTHQVACWLIDDYRESPFPLDTRSEIYRDMERQLAKLKGYQSRAFPEETLISYLQTRCLRTDISAGLRGGTMLSSLTQAVRYAVEDAARAVAKLKTGSHPAESPTPPARPGPQELTEEERARQQRDAEMIEKKRAYVRTHGRLPRGRTTGQEGSHV